LKSFFQPPIMTIGYWIIGLLNQILNKLHVILFFFQDTNDQSKKRSRISITKTHGKKHFQFLIEPMMPYTGLF
jgi:hypothetical protein